MATGGLIAVDVLGGTLGDRLHPPVVAYPLPPFSSSVTAVKHDWIPPPADGAVAPPPTTVFDQLESVYNADVEADADGFGDETQDLCAADPSRQTHASRTSPCAGPRRRSPSASGARFVTRSG
jgi:hypothetical protein